MQEEHPGTFLFTVSTNVEKGENKELLPTKKAEPRTESAFVAAVTAGFEPAVPLSEYVGLANRWFQPLTHVTSD